MKRVKYDERGSLKEDKKDPEIMRLLSVSLHLTHQNYWNENNLDTLNICSRIEHLVCKDLDKIVLGIKYKVSNSW